MDDDALREALIAWLRQQPDVSDDVRVEGLATGGMGHSAEMLSCTVVDTGAAGARRRDIVVKLRPPSPGLLEPYDLHRQFRIMQALAPTPVLAPTVLWSERSADVLGREFYVMARSRGDAFEQHVPTEFDAPGHIPAMCDSMIDQLAELHRLDPAAVGLDSLGDAATYVDRELAHWHAEMQRVQPAPLPALERLYAELVRTRPPRSTRTAIVHGDAKPGNFGFVGTEVTAVFDWEMTDHGDPMADIGYLDLMWRYPVGIQSRPTAPSIDHLVARWEDRTGMAATDREWWLAMQSFKTAVILLIGSMLFETGHTDDLRYFGMSLGIELTTQPGLDALGVDEPLETGPVVPSDARVAEARARTGH